MGFLDGIVEAVSGAWDTVVGFCATAVQTITNAVSTAVNTVSDALSGVGANIASAARNAVAYVGGRAYSLVSSTNWWHANNAIMELPDRARNAIAELLDMSPVALYSGTAIFTGLKELARKAYDAMVGSGLQWARNVVSALSAQIKDLLLLPVRAISNAFRK